MKINEITQEEWQKLNFAENTYFVKGCLIDNKTDNLVAFCWYQDKFHEAKKFYQVINEYQNDWNNSSKREKVKLLINYVLSDLKKITSLADLIWNVKKDAEMMNCSFSETGGIIADLCMNLEKYLLEYLTKLDGEVNK